MVECLLDERICDIRSKSDKSYEEHNADRPCGPVHEGCDSVGSAPAQAFLRQALGSNYGDVTLPSLLLSGALLVTVVAVLWKKRFGRDRDALDH